MDSHLRVPHGRKERLPRVFTAGKWYDCTRHNRATGALRKLQIHETSGLKLTVGACQCRVNAQPVRLAVSVNEA